MRSDELQTSSVSVFVQDQELWLHQDDIRFFVQDERRHEDLVESWKQEIAQDPTSTDWPNQSISYTASPDGSIRARLELRGPQVDITSEYICDVQKVQPLETSMTRKRGS